MTSAFTTSWSLLVSPCRESAREQHLVQNNTMCYFRQSLELQCGSVALWQGGGVPPPPCISYALVQATVGVGTVIIVYVI